MSGPESTGRNLYETGIGLIYQLEPKLSSGPELELGPVYESEPKIGFRLDFFLGRNFLVIEELDIPTKGWAHRNLNLKNDHG